MSQILESSILTEAGKKQLETAYKNMKARCYGKMQHCDHNYGARGITVCNEWLSDKQAFMAWAVLNDFVVGLTLDRRNSNLGYSPDNCRWVTKREQLLNQRRNHIVEFNGKLQPLSLWAEELGVEFSTLWRRLKRGLPLPVAMTAGKLRPWRHGTRAGYELHKCRCYECTANNTKRHQIQREKRKHNAHN